MRQMILPVTLALLAGCQPPGAKRASPEEVDLLQAAELPEPGVYVLQRVKHLGLSADLKQSGYDLRRGSGFERVLGGRLYVTSDSIYRTIFCADAVDSLGRVANRTDRGPGEGRYWAAGDRVYFSLLVTDGPQDSAAVGVHGDTVRFLGHTWVRDPKIPQPRYPSIDFICRAVRDSSVLKRHPRAWGSVRSPVVQ